MEFEQFARVDAELLNKLATVRALMFDVDGVLTDGGLTLGPQGEEYKRFHVRDGHGIKMLQNSGVTIAVITGRQSSVVAHRCNELGIKHVYQGCDDKLATYRQLADRLSVQATHCAFMGDDLIDLPVMRDVGVALTVANADSVVRNHADWLSQYDGGNGAAREACELIMHAQGTLASALEPYIGQTK